MSDNTTDGPRLLEVRAASDHELRLSYEDGPVGTLDLSPELHLGGVFALLSDPATFREVRLGEGGKIEWPSGIDLCPHALYMRITGRALKDVFPGLTRQSVDA